MGAIQTKLRKLLTGVLIMCILVSNSVPPLALAQEVDSGGSDTGFTLNLDWDETNFKDGDEYNLYEEANKSNAVKLRVNYSNKEVCEEGYKPGDLIITVKGIGAVGRAKKIEALVGADKQGATTKERDWSYTYNKTNDVYTFVNNNNIQPKSVVSGYFDMVWTLKAKDTIHNYSQDDIIAEMLLPDGSSVSSNTLSFTNNTKCDEYEVDIERSTLYSTAGMDVNLPVGSNIDDFVYIKYNLASHLQAKSRGVNGVERFIFNPDSNEIGLNAKVVYGTIDYIVKKDGTAQVALENNKGMGDQWVVVAYPREYYVASEVTATITSFGIYHEGDNKGNLNEVQLATDSIEFVVPSDFDFHDDGGSVHDIKVSEYEQKAVEDKNFNKEVLLKGGHVSSSTLLDGSIHKYFLGISKNIVGKRDLDTYELADDFFYVSDKEGNYQELTSKDYNIESVDILSTKGVHNENKLPVTPGKYKVEVYAVQNDETYSVEEDNLVWSGLWQDYDQNIELPDNTTAVGALYYDIEEALFTEDEMSDDYKSNLPQPMLALNVSYHLDRDDLGYNGQIANTSFLRIYGDKGNCVTSDEEDNYLDADINIDLAQKDMDTYGHYLDREKGAITFYAGEKNDYSSVTKLSAITYANNKFTADMTMGAKFKYSGEETPDKFSLYTVLPDSVTLNGYKIEEDIWDLVEFKGLDLDSDTLAEHCDAEVISNYKDSGRVYLALHFDFEGVDVPQDSSIEATFKIKIAKKYFKTNSIVDVISTAMVDEDILLYDIGKRVDDGSWYKNYKELLSDMDRDGNTQESIVYTNYSKAYTYVDSSELQMNKSVMTSSIDEYVQAPVVPLAEQGTEYSYLLSVRNGNSLSKGIVVNDILETGENAEWQGTFKNVDLSEAEDLGLTGTVWYSDKDNPGTVGGSDWSQDMEASKVKAVAIDFGDSELGAGGELNIYVNMVAPEEDAYKGKVTENEYSVSFTMLDATTGDETKQDNLNSNPVQVELCAKLKTIVLTYLDAEDDSRLSNGEYVLVNEETGEEIASGTTNGKGQIVFKSVPSDASYILKQTKVPEGYKGAEDIKVSFEEGSTLQVTGESDRKVAKVTLSKANFLDALVKVGGAEYTIFTEDGEEVKKAVTDLTGNITFEGIEWGKYYIQETKAPEGYTLSTDKLEFEVTRYNVDEVQHFNVKDTQDGVTSVKLTKYAKTVEGVQTKTALQGAVFDLVKVTGNQNGVLGTYVTDKNGEIVVEDLAYGDYILRETRAPKGYTSTSNVEFSITPENKVVEVVAYNQMKPGSIHIFKKDNMGNPINDVVFELYDSTKANVLGTYTTDETGSIDIPNMEWGTYYLKEKSAPECYTMDEDWHEVNINGSNLNEDLAIVNGTKKGAVRLVKSDEIGIVRLQGAVFNLYHEDGSIVSVEKDGERVLQQNLVTDKNGEILVEGLEWGKYYFKETKAPTGYGLTDETIRFAVNSLNAGTEQSIVVSNPTESRVITITKTLNANDINFSNGDPTFLFKIVGKDVNGTESTYYRMIRFDENYVAANKSDEGVVSQSVTLSGIVAGKYTVIEEESSRYVLNEVTGSENVEFLGLTATVDITEDSEGSVEFLNNVYEHGYFSDNDSVSNSLKAQVRLTGIKAEWTGGEVEVYSEIDKSKVKVTALYDNGTSSELNSSEWAIADSYQGTTFPNVNGDYGIPVTYTEGGITKTTNFDVTIFGAIKEKVIRLDVVFLDEDNTVKPGTLVRPGMFEVYAVYNDLSREKLDVASDIVITPDNFPEEEGLCDVTLSLSKDKFDEDVSSTVSVNVKLPDPVLMAGPAFNKIIPTTAKTVIFTDEVAPSGAGLTDVSADGDGSVQAWLEDTTWKISSQRPGTKVVANEDSSQMFMVNYVITSVDFTGLDTSKVTTFGSLFDDCTTVTSITFGDFDTSNVTNMASMFWGCRALTSLDLSGFDTSKVTTMSWMLSTCTSLKTLDLSNFDTSKVNDMRGMFHNSSGLTSIDLSSFDTSSVNYGTDFEGGFYQMFEGCSSLKTLDLSHFDTSGVVSTYHTFRNCKSLTSLNLDGWDTSNVTSMSRMFAGCSKLTSLDVSHFDTSSNTSLKEIFNGCSGLTELDVSNWDTSKVTAFNSVFNGCSKLTSIDIRKWDTSKATTMAGMFANVTVTELDIDHFKTSNVTDMSSMFHNCRKLKDFDLSKFDVRNVIKMSNMFTSCEAITDLDLSNFKPTSSVNMSNMFKGCIKLKTLDIRGLKTYSEGNAALVGTFDQCNLLEKVTVGTGYNGGNSIPAPSPEYIVGATNKWYSQSQGFGCTSIPSGMEETYVAIQPFVPESGILIPGDVFKSKITSSIKSVVFTDIEAPSNVTVEDLSTACDGSIVGWTSGTTYYVSSQEEGVAVKANSACGNMFYNKDITSIDFSNLDTSLMESMYLMFYSCDKLTTLDISNFDTSKVTNMNGVFEYCSKLTSITLGDFDVSEVKDMSYMFYDCRVLSNLDVSSFGTSKVETTKYMFYNCSALTELDFSNFATPYLNDIYYMFYYCSGLTTLDLSKFDTSNLTSLEYMFKGCSSLVELDLSSFNTSNVTSMREMFYDCSSLTDIDVSNFDTSKVEDMSYMFKGCKNLPSVGLSNFDTSNVITMENMFMYCYALKELDLSSFKTPKLTNMDSMFYMCHALRDVDLSSFDTSNVTDMSYLFYSCGSLETVDLSSFNTSKVTSMANMFSGCSLLKSLDLTNFDTSSLKNINQMFASCTSLITLDLSSFDTRNTSGVSVFTACNNLSELIVGENYKFNGAYPLDPNPNYIAHADGYWYNEATGQQYDNSELPDCVAATYVAVNPNARILLKGSEFNSKIPNGVTEIIFTDDKAPNNAELVDVSQRQSGSIVAWLDDTTWYVSTQEKGELMQLNNDSSRMFSMCDKVTNFDFSNVVLSCDDASFMFAGCSSLVSLDITDFNAKPLNTIKGMFSGCSSLKDLNLNYFEAVNVRDVSSLFRGCSSLETINISRIRSSLITDMSNVFNGCESLKSLSFAWWNSSKVKTMKDMFKGCVRLEEVTLGDDFVIMEDGYLPAPDPEYIDGADGAWYSDWGYRFEPEELTTGLSTYKAVAPDERFIMVAGSTFKSKIPYTARSVVFTTKKAPENAELKDLSKRGNGGVVAWLEDTVWYVSTQRDDRYAIANPDSSRMFSGKYELKAIDLSCLDTSQVTNMSEMFDCAFGIKSLDLSNFNTSNVTSMEGMFANCYDLEEVDVSSFDTSQVTNMRYMFENCCSLEELDVSNFDTALVTNMYAMFRACFSLRSLNISNFIINEDVFMNDLIAGNLKLETISLGEGFVFKDYVVFPGVSWKNVDTGVEYAVEDIPSNVEATYQKIKSDEYRYHMADPDILSTYLDFEYVNAIIFTDEKAPEDAGTVYDVSINGDGSVVMWCPDDGQLAYHISTQEEGQKVIAPKDCSYLFYGFYLNELGLSYLDTSKVEDMSYMFAHLNMSGTLDISDLDTSNVVNMSHMFAGNEDITELDVSGLDTSKVVDMSYMFEWCEGLTEINVSNFDTSNVVTMEGMFEYCCSVEDLDVSNFDTSNVENMSGMFNYCDSLTELDVSNFNTSKVTDMAAMFSCAMLEELDVSNFDTSSVVNMDWIFSQCTRLKKLDLSNFDTSNVLYMNYLFSWCRDLEELDLSGFDTSNVIESDEVFDGCTHLEKVTVGDKLDFSELDYLPTPHPDTIGGATGYWYDNATRLEYESDEIPSNTAATYVAYPFWMEGMLLRGQSFNDVIPYEVTSVIFTDEVAPEGIELLDVSALSDGTIVSWLVDETCYVSTQRDGVKIKANTDSSRMFAYKENLESIDLSNLDTSGVVYMSEMFKNCYELGNLDLSTFNTSNVLDMYGMFWDCQSLTTLDLTSFDTSNVAYMNWMFAYCLSLEEITWSDTFVTNNVLDMYSMFNSCESLISLDVSNFDTSNVTNMDMMFQWCLKLTELDVSGFDTSNVFNMYAMFAGCESLAKLDLSSFDTISEDTYMGWMFADCFALSEVKIGKDFVFNDFDEDENCYFPPTYWYDVDSEEEYRYKDIPDGTDAIYKKSVEGHEYTLATGSVFNSLVSQDATSIVFTDVTAPSDAELTDLSVTGDGSVVGWLEDTTYYVSSQKTDQKIIADAEADYMFAERWILSSIDLSNLDTSNITSMMFMFSNCGSLAELDLSGFNTSKVTDMSYMFAWCYELTDLTISNFDTSKVINMINMFNSCERLETIDTGSFVTSNVVNMESMFYNCASVRGIDTASFDTSKVTDMSSMFGNCSNLESIELGNFDTSNVEYMDSMFHYCGNLNSLDVSGFNTAKVTNMSSMFRGCSKLDSLDLGNFDTSNVEYMSQMFYGCSNLKSVDLSSFNTEKVKSMYAMFRDCSKIESLNLSNFNTFSVTDMDRMFQNCANLEKLDISNFNTRNMSHLNYVFSDCTKLEEVKLGSNFEFKSTVANHRLPSTYSGTWYNKETKVGYTPTAMPSNVAATYTSNPSWMQNAVAKNMYNNIPSTATSVVFTDDVAPTGVSITDLSVLRDKSVVGWSEGTTYYVSTQREGVKVSTISDSLYYMFYNKTALKSIDFTNLDTSGATTMYRMFYYCTGLESLDISNFDTSHITDISYAFYNCKKLATLDFRTLDFSSVTAGSYAFSNCSEVTLALSKTQEDADILNKTSSKPSTMTFYPYDKIVEVGVENQCSDVITISMPDVLISGVSKITLNPKDASKAVISFKVNGQKVDGYTYTVSESGTLVISEPEFVDVVVIESEHDPYPNGMNSTADGINGKVYGEARFKGAKSLNVILDVQTESANYDWVSFYDSTDTLLTTSRYGGATRTTHTIVLPGDYVKVAFRTDISINNYYGFKAIIFPNY